MKKKFDLPSFLGKYWFYYLLWLVLVVFAWEWAFAFLTKPKEEESVYLFFGVENARTDQMYTDLISVKPDYVRNLDLTWYSTRTESFNTLFVTRIQSEADVFVLPEQYCEPATMNYLFYPMDTSVVKELFGEDAEYAETTYEGKVYGVKIYDKNTATGRATTYLTYTYQSDGVDQAVGNYYLFFNRKSKHLGKLSGSTLDGALILAQAIWNKE